MTGADIGRCGAGVVTSCSASESSSGRVVSTTAFRPGASRGRSGGRTMRSVIGSWGSSAGNDGRASAGRRCGRERDRLAYPGGAGAAQDVIVELRPEVSHPARQWERREPLVVAERALDDVVREVDEELHVGRARPALDDPVTDLDETARADPAGARLPARLVRAELREEAGEVDRARSVIGDDDAARPDVGPRGAQGVELVRRVERVGRQEAAGRA